MFVLCGLTFELSGRRRQDARPGLAKMYRVPPARAWWPAVGAPLERGVRSHSPHFDYALTMAERSQRSKGIPMTTSKKHRTMVSAFKFSFANCTTSGFSRASRK